MLNKITLVASLTLSLVFTGSVAAAGDVAAGKVKSAACANCHGADGTNQIPSYPNLKGQKSAYTAKQLRAFRDKTRADPIMAGMSAGLTDADIDNLAAYYESLK